MSVVRNFRKGKSGVPVNRGFSRSRTPWYDLVPKDPKANAEWREELIRAADDDPRMQREIWEACAREPLFWFNAFGWTFDPRLDGVQVLPFITYDVQDELIYEIFQALGYYDLVIEKSRDEGASCISMGCLTHQWQFKANQKFSAVSRKGDLVDKTGDQDTLFYKIMFMADMQPGWLKPFYLHNEMMLLNPEMQSTIVGESATGEVGRGGRNRAMFIDEFGAFNRDDGYKVEAATTSNCDCKIYNSTPRGTGNAFFDARQGLIDGTRSGKLLKIHWSEDPRKNMGLYTNGKGYKDFYPGASDHDRFSDHDIVMLDRSPDGREIEEWDFDVDYNFILDGKIRSPWYDMECKRYPHPMLVAQELDCDFHNSSFRFFDETVLQKVLETQVWEPYVKGEFRFDEGGDYVGFEEKEDGHWKLWLRLDEHGRPNRRIEFALAADVSAGTGASNSAVSGGNAVTGEKLIEYVNPRISPEDFGRLFGKVCGVFNDAYAIWENNGPGRMFGPKALSEGIQRFYHRKDDPSIKHKVTDIPGWASTKERKLALLSNYRDAQHKNKITNPSHYAVTECREYVNQPDGSVEHVASKGSVDPTGAGSAHGDVVMADALLYKAMTELQRGISVEEVDYDNDDGFNLERPPHPGCLAYRNMLHEQTEAKQKDDLWVARR